ncbi:hypothetical protein BpHYR1_007093 [Brachionus plicatilis]|uniref:Uncharacterized protein n=1 Tax=Brachionus plicatilis TaxID=10195 RepID=A0A3M7SXS1_BRAPC|nr:hypothetical protein BpHYR1_007093 [Brachionus plicatilis]
MLFFAVNLAASDDSTGTKAISLMKKIFDFNKKNFMSKFCVPLLDSSKSPELELKLVLNLHLYNCLKANSAKE